MKKSAVPEILHGYLTKPLVIYPAYAQLIGNLSGAAFLARAVYWQMRAAPRNGGWWFHSATCLQEQCHISRCEHEQARQRLKKLMILKEIRAGIPGRIWYKIDFDALAAALASTAPGKKSQHRCPGRKCTTTDGTARTAGGAGSS